MITSPSKRYPPCIAFLPLRDSTIQTSRPPMFPFSYFPTSLGLPVEWRLRETRTLTSTTVLSRYSTNFQPVLAMHADMGRKETRPAEKSIEDELGGDAETPDHHVSSFTPRRKALLPSSWHDLPKRNPPLDPRWPTLLHGRARP
jgi:hypothetical protein